MSQLLLSMEKMSKITKKNTLFTIKIFKKKRRKNITHLAIKYAKCINLAKWSGHVRYFLSKNVQKRTNFGISPKKVLNNYWFNILNYEIQNKKIDKRHRPALVRSSHTRGIQQFIEKWIDDKDQKTSLNLEKKWMRFE